MARTPASIGSIREPALRAKAAHQALSETEVRRAELISIRKAAIAELRADGWSWQDVATLLGLHRNRAAQLIRGHDRRPQARR
jgi:hypothetical protein